MCLGAPGKRRHETATARAAALVVARGTMGEGARVESPLSTQSRAAYARLAPARFLLTEEMPWLAGKGY